MAKGRSGGGARPAPRPAATSRAKPTTTHQAKPSNNTPAVQSKPAATPAAQKPAQQPAQQQQAPHAPAPQAAPVQSGGTGFLGTLFASAAGSAVGHVVGRTVMNAFEGNGDKGEQPQEYEQQQPQSVESVQTSPQEDSQVCFSERKSLLDCLQGSRECQWAMDNLNECQAIYRSQYQKY